MRVTFSRLKHAYLVVWEASCRSSSGVECWSNDPRNSFCRSTASLLYTHATISFQSPALPVAQRKLIICARYVFDSTDFLRHPITDLFVTFVLGIYLTSKEKLACQFPKDAPPPKISEGRKKRKNVQKDTSLPLLRFISQTVQDRWVVSVRLDRKSYPLCQLVTLPTTLSAHNHTRSPHFLRLAPTSVSTKREYIEISNLVRKSQLADEKLPLKRVWSPSCDTF